MRTMGTVASMGVSANQQPTAQLVHRLTLGTTITSVDVAGSILRTQFIFAARSQLRRTSPVGKGTFPDRVDEWKNC